MARFFYTCRFIVFYILIFSYISSAQNVEIKALQTYIGKEQRSLPIIFDKSTLTIEFDIKTDEYPLLAIKFLFCNRYWKVYENTFLNNPFRNISRNLWFDQLPTYVKRANYHFRGSFPNEEVSFLFSGKWIYQIISAHDEDIVFEEGSFIVVKPDMNLRVILERKRIDQNRWQNNDMNRIFDVSVQFNLPDTLFPSEVLDVEIIQNSKIFYPTVLEKENTKLRYFEWDADRNFKFGARDIYPGNTYRQADLNDIYWFPSPSAFAQKDKIETSDFYRSPRRDNFGGSVLINFKNHNAQYIDTKFQLRAPDNFDKDIFLVGAFNNWLPMTEFQLKNNDGLYSTTVELKRGKYDYQYITGYNVRGEIADIDWNYFEGNEWNRNNVFYVLVFYNYPLDGGYDKIIGFKKFYSDNYE